MRFGTGDAIDEFGSRSGQLDIVLEFPFLPSFPVLGVVPRVYLVESIAAVIEVKSNVCTQWQGVLNTARKLASLRKNEHYFFNAQIGLTMERIPFFAIGYEGWKKAATAKKRLTNEPIDGILVIESGAFVSSTNFHNIESSGPESLWWLIWCLQRSMRILNTASDIPTPTGYVSN